MRYHNKLMRLLPLFSAFLFLLVTMGSAPSVMASSQLQFDTSESATLPDAHDYVDIGNPASEAGHTLIGWGPIEPDTHGGGWGGIGAESPPGKCRTIWSPEEDDPVEKWASLELDFGTSATGSKCLTYRHLDGGSGDSFDLSIDGTVVQSISAPPSTETWYWASFDVTGYTGVHTVKFEATGDAGSYFTPYGQVAIDKIYIGTQVTPVPADADPIACSQTKRVDFHFNLDCNDGPIRGYTVRVLCPPGEDVLSFDDGDITVNVLPEGLPAADFMWQVYPSPYGAATNDWTIDYAILGDAALPDGIPSDKDLFSIDFHGVGNGTGHVIIEHAEVGLIPGGTPPPVGGNATTITVDCIAPQPVTDITATPGHNKVHVAWVHDDVDVDHYEIFRGLWYNGTVGQSAYPEYDDLTGSTNPTRPIGHESYIIAGEWVRVGTVAVGTSDFTDVGAVNGTGTFNPDGSDRGVYAYEVFAVDATNNPSAIADANARATNYWLGDVTGIAAVTVPDGLVNPFDMSDLGTAFGTTGTSGGAYNNLVDVGPTDDWSRLGIPTTDSHIDFEDLMIFSMNFGVVTDAKANVPLSNSVDLVWVSYEDGTMALRLESGSGLKGLRVTADRPVRNVTAGRLLDDQSELTFLKNVGTNLDANMAVMGFNNGFNGQGDLVVISADKPITVRDLKITARGIDNSQMAVNLDMTNQTTTPRMFSLDGNYPNPFNPSTHIGFSLPETQNVKLAVFSVDGRRVVTLLDAIRGPGHYEVIWTGRDDRGQTVATGTYFYRIKAGPYSKVRKMSLIK